MKKQTKTFFICVIFGVAILVTTALAETVTAEFKMTELDKKFMNLNYEGRYVVSAGGVVKDKKSGLEWLAGPDQDTTWNEAQTWLKNLSTGGGNWRMPTEKELKTLFINKEGTRNMSTLIKTTGWWVWAQGTEKDYNAWLYSFGSNGGYFADRAISLHRRAFAVRSAK